MKRAFPENVSEVPFQRQCAHKIRILLPLTTMGELHLQNIDLVCNSTPDRKIVLKRDDSTLLARNLSQTFRPFLSNLSVVGRRLCNCVRAQENLGFKARVRNKEILPGS